MLIDIMSVTQPVTGEQDYYNSSCWGIIKLIVWGIFNVPFFSPHRNDLSSKSDPPAQK